MGNPRLYRRLGPGETADLGADLKRELDRLAARVLRACPDADLVFVGRSLELLYDLLCGALNETSRRGGLTLLQLSLFRHDERPGGLRRNYSGELAHLWSYADAIRVTPERILERERPVAFVDVVDRGRTYGNLSALLHHWCAGSEARWSRLRQRLRWVGVTDGDHETWQPDDSRWTRDYAPEQVITIPVFGGRWYAFAEEVPKTTDCYAPGAWADPPKPPEDPDRIAAARLARSLFRRGAFTRRALARRLQHPPTSTALEALAEELLS